MKQVDILAQLEQVLDGTQARMDPSVFLPEGSAEARSKAALGRMHATVLPRVVRITNDQDDAVTLSVIDGRISAMTESLMDGVQATPPETTAEHVAQILNMVCSGTGVQLLSTPPDDASDIAATGLLVSEVDAAIDALEPVHSTTPPAEGATFDAPAASTSDSCMAARFYEAAEKISDQRILVGHRSGTTTGPESDLTQNMDAVQQMMDDLSAWETDSDTANAGPQLVIMRAQGQDAPSLTICRDADATTMAAHHTRKLGSVVQLWKSLTTQENIS